MMMIHDSFPLLSYAQATFPILLESNLRMRVREREKERERLLKSTLMKCDTRYSSRAFSLSTVNVLYLAPDLLPRLLLI